MRIDLAVHIVAGALGIVLGFIALFAAKGQRTHRRAGIIFVCSMIVMALMGAGMAVARGIAATSNAPIGVLTAYLVVTALTTVRGAPSRRIDGALMLVALTVAVLLMSFGAAAAMSPTGKHDGMPAAPFFIFGAVALLATIGDVRLLRAGGVHTARGPIRIARHLWRMTFALLIAAFSFFIGQAKVIPEPIRIIPLLLIPPLVVLAALLYWLWRVRVRRSLSGVVVVARPRMEHA